MTDRSKPIHHPYVVFTGASTPGRLMESLSNTQVADGFLNRLLLFRSDAIPALTMRQDDAVPDNIRDRLLAVGGFVDDVFTKPDETAPNPGVIPIPIDRDGEVIRNAFSREADERMAEPIYGPLWSRAHENALKVAGLVSLGCDGTITGVIMQWSVNLVRDCLQGLGQNLEADMAESPFEASCKKALKHIRNVREYGGDAAWGAYCRRGLMPRGELSKLMRTKPRDLDDVVKSLVEALDIEEIKVAGKGQRKVVAYRCG